jgi:ABC-type glycerol-3-phosphate transport system substrate-binding protein
MEKIQKFIKSKSRIFIVLFAVAIIPFFSGCGTATTGGYSVKLEIWGTMDDSSDYAAILEEYKKINPYVTEIKYRKFAQETYRQELLDALASGNGPDIFMIGNGWLPSFGNKLEPAPAPLMSEQDVKNNFPDVVAGDFMDGGYVYAAPLTIDSMQLYYNRDMFNAAGITSPPKTWLEFQTDVQKLTKLDANGNFSLSGGAIGTGININRSSDLLSLLMMQNGAVFPTAKGTLAKFDEGIIGPDGSVIQAGQQALGFYTQFAKLSTAANTANPFYAWNNRQHYSVDAFAEGSVAMMFNYSWQLDVIKQKNPKLNFSVVPVPQINADKPVGFANYWGYGVARNKVAPATSVGGQLVAPVSNAVRTHEAWQFLRFLTLKNSGTVTLYNAVTKNSKPFAVNFDPAADYLKKTNQPAARRDLIENQKTDINLGVFAAGNIIAKHWYQADPEAIDKIFIDMIESVDRGDVGLREALTLAKNKINYLSGAAR